METNYLRIYRIDFHQMFRNGSLIDGDHGSNLRFPFAQGILPWLPNLGQKTAMPTPSFGTLALRNGLEDRDSD